MSFRLAASVVAAALLCGCGGPKSGDTATGPATSPAASAPAAAPAPTPGGPANAAAVQAGRPGAVALDDAQRRELAAAVAKAPPALRSRLRYALAAGDDGKRHLVVYDGQGLPANGRNPGKANQYVLFQVLNARGGEHYDPQQNSIVAPIPPPVQRDNPVKQ
jgi:hypothetical protein